jgi:signal transduction histidine kinase
MIQSYRSVWKNILIMAGFGILSIILGYIQFVVPGMDGGSSDLREIGILLSIIFLPNWIYILGVSFIGSLSFPLNNLEVSTILMHFTASLFAWFFYSFIKNKSRTVYLQGILWASMVVVYYVIFLIPTLIIVFYLFKVINSSEIFSNYKNVLYAYRFEMFTSATVTSLFLVLYKTTKILEVRNKEIEQALIKSEESDRLKTAFLNNINHEIRTPLNGIIGFTHLLSEPDLDDKSRVEYSKLIVSSSNQLLTIISNIIEFSEIKTGQVKLRNVSISINELFHSFYLHYSRSAKGKNLLFKTDLADIYADNYIITDKNCLQQILGNLLDNAFKFTKEGSVTVSFKRKEDMATFSVKDTGSGIDPDSQKKIFEYFSKIEKKDEKFHPGTGLGLSISKALVEHLGGNINVESEPGKGSVFSFTIPCKPI